MKNFFIIIIIDSPYDFPPEPQKEKHQNKETSPENNSEGPSFEPPKNSEDEKDATYWKKKYEEAVQNKEPKDEKQTEKKKKSIYLPKFSIFIVLVSIGVFAWTSKIPKPLMKTY